MQTRADSEKSTDQKDVNSNCEISNSDEQAEKKTRTDQKQLHLTLNKESSQKSARLK